MINEIDVKRMSKVVAKCWADEGFKQRLLADPVATLRAEGADVPEGMSIKVLANDRATIHLVIPAKPVDLLETELSEAELDKVAGGLANGCHCTHTAEC